MYLNGEVSYNYNLGWETALKFYFDKDIWESSYLGIFHSYRRSSADLINISDGSGDIQGYAYFNRSHLGIRYGSRFFLDELWRAGERWVIDASYGLSYATWSSENYAMPFADFEALNSVYLHFGISIGFLTEERN